MVSRGRQCRPLGDRVDCWRPRADGLHRLIKVEEGDSSAAASFGTEDWSASGPGKLSQTGNWNGVSRSSPAWGAVARSITGTFNKVNELLSFVDTQSGTAVTTTQAYSPNGELIDDGARYLYRYDAWGRMVEVKSRDGKSVSRYRYNGLGYRIGWQYHHPDTSGGLGDGIVDADPWYWLVYNDRWQQIAAYRIPGGSSSSWSGSAEARPKEIITHHMAGMDGRGGSSYIDSVVCRERDNAGWGDAALNGSGASAWAIASRLYLLQNWRADVVMSLSSDTSKAVVIDRVRYTAYGQPIRWSAYDLASGPTTAIPDASFDSSDSGVFTNAFALGSTIADVNFDGVVDGTDYLLFAAAESAGDEGPLGPGYVSRDVDAGFRRGYAGYEFDPVLSAAGGGIYHVRNRVYDSETGRWDRRDPLGYVDGMGLYEYCKGQAVRRMDPPGLASMSCLEGVNAESAPDPCAAEQAEYDRARANLRHTERLLRLTNPLGDPSTFQELTLRRLADIVSLELAAKALDACRARRQVTPQPEPRPCVLDTSSAPLVLNASGLIEWCEAQRIKNYKICDQAPCRTFNCYDDAAAQKQRCLGNVAVVSQ